MKEFKPEKITPEEKQFEETEPEKKVSEEYDMEDNASEEPVSEETAPEKKGPEAENPEAEESDEEEPDKEIKSPKEKDPGFWQEDTSALKEEEERDNEAYEARRLERAERMRRRKKKQKRRKILTGVLSAAAVVVVGTMFYFGDDFLTNLNQKSLSSYVSENIAALKERMTEDKTGSVETGSGQDNTQADVQSSDDDTQADGSAAGEASEGDGGETSQDSRQDGAVNGTEALIAQADLYAAQYNYNKAIKLLKNDPAYESSQAMQQAVEGYRETKASCTAWPLDQVTHVFYHTLIKDTSKAFDGDYKQGDYNQVMTTIDEFNKITQSMYDKGYVMVSLKDIASVNDDGTMTPGEILLPPGKIPFVLSQDDVSYYHYMEGDGYASKLVVDDEGKVRNEYVEEDGSISVGDYDMVPLIDRFVEEHPDFSYRGAKGIVALTGYNGILGYRTDSSYETRPDDLDANKAEWLDSHPDFSLEKEREGAKKVADAMKAEGWAFASHTWGHKNMTDISMERLQKDTQLFKENVDPLIGGTDIIIFAFGADLITGTDDYYGDNFEYLKSQGYNYYCNVDSQKYFVQIRDRYLRMGRRNLDGYRMYYNPELVDDLFDASAVFDPARPLPVPPMG